MAEATVANPKPISLVDTWIQELESIGRVEIKSSFKSLIWRVGLAVAIVAFVIYARYQAGDIGQRGLTIAVIGSGVLIIACLAFVKMKYGGKSIVIERDSLTTMEGMRIPWTDIVDVTIFTAPRSDNSVLVNLTEDAWIQHMATQQGGGKMLHKANKFITRNRSIVLPSYLDAPQNDLVELLNRYAQGRPES